MRERVIFGEMTWYPEGGLGRFKPDTYDLQVGQALTLPKPVVVRNKMSLSRLAALSNGEAELLLRLCRALGIDHGELDAEI